jgi:hypothetical protein
MSLNLEELAARVASEAIPKIASPPPTVAPKPSTPTHFWTCVGRTGGTYTPGTDWLPQFESPAGTKWAFELPSPTGCLMLLIRDATTNAGRLARVQFFAERAFSAVCDLRMTAGRVQIKVNGTLAEYTSSGQVTLSFAEGLNVVEVMGDASTSDIVLLGRFYDGVTAWWSSPNLNPVRAVPDLAQRGSSEPPLTLDGSL